MLKNYFSANDTKDLKPVRKTEGAKSTDTPEKGKLETSETKQNHTQSDKNINSDNADKNADKNNENQDAKAQTVSEQLKFAPPKPSKDSSKKSKKHKKEQKQSDNTVIKGAPASGGHVTGSTRAPASGVSSLAGMVSDLKQKAETEQLDSDPDFAGWLPPKGKSYVYDAYETKCINTSVIGI